MDFLAQVTLVWHCHSEFSDSDKPSVLKQSVYVVVDFLSQVIFVFLLFLGIIMYANEVETKEK